MVYRNVFSFNDEAKNDQTLLFDVTSFFYLCDASKSNWFLMVLDAKRVLFAFGLIFFIPNFEYLVSGRL
jgi:hypothetical protein